MRALDASVIIGFLDPADAHHSRAARLVAELLATRDELITSAAAYAEVLVEPSRSGLTAVVDGFLDDARVGVVAIDRDCARAAAGLRARHATLRLPDALSLANALLHDAELVTFDRRLARLAATEAV